VDHLRGGVDCSDTSSQSVSQSVSQGALPMWLLLPVARCVQHLNYYTSMSHQYCQDQSSALVEGPNTTASS
jgi:hypothetical protein